MARRSGNSARPEIPEIPKNTLCFHYKSQTTLRSCGISVISGAGSEQMLVDLLINSNQK